MRRGFVLAVLAVMTLPGAARADVWVAPTNLTIHVSGGEVSGKLAGRPECRDAQRIELLADAVRVDFTTTDPDGSYTFASYPIDALTLQASFPGSRTGLHPHRHDCLPSVSKTLFLGGLTPTSGLSVAGIAPSPGASAGGAGAAGGPVLLPAMLAVLVVLGLRAMQRRHRAESVRLRKVD